MIKRTSAFVFILLANIVLMAHVVVPHHYHQKKVCLERNHCQDDGIENNHNTPEHNHEHDGKNNSTNCVLKQAIVLPSNHGKHVFDFVNSTNNQSHFNLFISFNTGFEEIISDFILTSFIPYISSSYSFYVTSSLGLRAPPSV